MRKVFRYMRSMRFGILLLCLIAACSVAGTVIPQGREVAWYAQNYPSAHPVILTFRLNRVFESWYFITLLVLLCLNLSLCSLLRIRTVVRASHGETERAATMPDTVLLRPEGMEKLRAWLEDRHCRSVGLDGTVVYHKNGIGRYGTFLLHLSILLTLVFGALALYTPTVTDQSCMPGESILLEDGTEIHVLDFHITDETGRLDYRSHVQVTLPDGRRSEEAELSVNHPFSFGAYKLFQQSFGTAGSVTVTNLETGGTDDFLLTEQAYLSADGITGIFYETLYPDFIRDPSGNVTFITITEGSYPNPIYQFEVISDGEFTPTLAVPGDELEITGLRFTFNKPVEYPGIRIKHVSRIFNALLIASFMLMIAGLTLAFFFEPVLVKTDAEGYAVGGPKPEHMRIELGEEFRAYERSTKEETT